MSTCFVPEALYIIFYLTLNTLIKYISLPYFIVQELEAQRGWVMYNTEDLGFKAGKPDHEDHGHSMWQTY